MSRRGRPRKLGTRKPSGDLRLPKSVNDLGTIELLLHRAELVSPEIVSGLRRQVVNSNVMLELADTEYRQKAAIAEGEKARKQIHTLANDRRLSYVLGLLLARHTITSGQHYAGGRYASLYFKAVRRPSINGTLGNLVGGGRESGIIHDTTKALEDAAEDRTSYLAARKVLTRAGMKTSRVVDAVCVFETLPSPQDYDDLRMGLELLRDHFEAEGRKR